MVSTHSRPKAAGSSHRRIATSSQSFNTQPPEGGWHSEADNPTQPKVSTHSRPKAAGSGIRVSASPHRAFQHTAARRRLASSKYQDFAAPVFQHTAARRRLAIISSALTALMLSFNTQPPEGGWWETVKSALISGWFQHTAARRRLEAAQIVAEWLHEVSTHSRPKAAGCAMRCAIF